MILTLISTTAMSGTETNITSGIDSDYKEYWFVFTDVEPATDGSLLQFQGSIDAGSNYNVAITASSWDFYGKQDDSDQNVRKNTASQQGTSYFPITAGIGGGAASDECAAGIFKLYNPSEDGTFVKHFTSTFSMHRSDDYMDVYSTGGYLNTTSNIDAVSFGANSGNIVGTLQFFGVN